MIPTLERSRRWPRSLPRTARRSFGKDATLKVYPGASHGLTFTHKDELDADLLACAKG
jgi:pimeloyl-ACP methyl ester carboxylesterase